MPRIFKVLRSQMSCLILFLTILVALSLDESRMFRVSLLFLITFPRSPCPQCVPRGLRVLWTAAPEHACPSANSRPLVRVTCTELRHDWVDHCNSEEGKSCGFGTQQISRQFACQGVQGPSSVTVCDAGSWVAVRQSPETASDLVPSPGHLLEPLVASL